MKGVTAEGFFYHLGQVGNQVDWSKKLDDESFTKQLREEYKKQVVPLDMQFRISRILIIITNLLAEKGDDAWHAVFNPYDRKTSLKLN